MLKDPNLSCHLHKIEVNFNCFCIYFNNFVPVYLIQLYSKRKPVYKDFPEKSQLGRSLCCALFVMFFLSDRCFIFIICYNLVCLSKLVGGGNIEALFLE